MEGRSPGVPHPGGDPVEIRADSVPRLGPGGHRHIAVGPHQPDAVVRERRPGLGLQEIAVPGDSAALPPSATANNMNRGRLPNPTW